MMADEEIRVSVTGLGYVGLPLALAVARHFPTIGFDHNAEYIDRLRRHEAISGVSADDFNGANIAFSDKPENLAQANFHIVAVPTPIDSSCAPDITLLKQAMKSVARALKRGDTVVIESTVYPGCTEEDCLPILEEVSGLKVDADFGLGYSPERINPGDRAHTLQTVCKVISARTPEQLERVKAVYGKVATAGLYEAPNIKVAEAAKIIENTQRDINIALMNELSLIFSRMGIETADVIAAASTKWNFLPFRPGLVGGHCIGIDPYYLDFKARQLGYHTQMVSSGRYVNDSMGRYVAKQTIKRLIANGFHLTDVRILLMGLTYKENVVDVRNSRSIDIIDELKSFGVANIDVCDPVASAADSQRIYGFAPIDKPSGMYDAIIVAVAHDAFRNLDRDFFDAHLRKGGVVSDVHGIFRRKVDGIDAWRL